jgi:hypothetical protein
MSSVSLNVPWVPSIAGNDLQPCPIIQDLVEDDILPDNRRTSERAWSTKSTKAEVDKASETYRKAIAESIVAIWRLVSREAEGEGDPSWVDHVAAWMVRQIVGWFTSVG